MSETLKSKHNVNCMMTTEKTFCLSQQLWCIYWVKYFHTYFYGSIIQNIFFLLSGASLLDSPYYFKSCTHKLQIQLSVILSIRPLVLLSGASLCVCHSLLCACVRLSVWHSLSAGQRLNGGPCHISLGLSYWSLSVCQLVVVICNCLLGILTIFLTCLWIARTATLSPEDSHDIWWWCSWKLCYCSARNGEKKRAEWIETLPHR